MVRFLIFFKKIYLHFAKTQLLVLHADAVIVPKKAFIHKYAELFCKYRA